VVEALNAGKRFLVTSHPSPDGDAIACMVAAALALRSLGRKVTCYNPDPVPRRFRFLVGAELIGSERPVGRFDTTLLLDCSDSALLASGKGGLPHQGRLVVIDHHLTEGDLGDVVLRDPTAAAAGVLLYRVLCALGVQLTPAIAEALFCSIMSDTGSFRYQNANSEALNIAAVLVDRGVDPWHVASHIYEDRPRSELELLALVLQTLQVSSDGRAACLTVTPEMLRATGCPPAAIDGIINYARGVEGVEVAILFRPGPAGVRVSLRSRGNVDVSQIAERFGGGGHRNAAGCMVADDLERVREGLFGEVGRVLGSGA
jgi:bifunctional oligoribonuclease and PAP phosphatase NrnA